MDRNQVEQGSLDPHKVGKIVLFLCGLNSRMARGGTKELKEQGINKQEKHVSLATPQNGVTAAKNGGKENVNMANKSKPAAVVCKTNLEIRAQKRDERLYAKALDECIRREKHAANVSVEFKVGRHTFFGQQVKVVGDNEQLGSWNPEKATALKWGEGDIWTCTMEVPRSAGQLEYKYILVDPDTLNCSWEGGSNRVVALPKDSAQEKLHLQDIWS